MKNTMSAFLFINSLVAGLSGCGHDSGADAASLQLKSAAGWVEVSTGQACEKTDDENESEGGGSVVISGATAGRKGCSRL